MRIGILTFSAAHNFGAHMQCYALQQTLLQLGHEVEVIDYRPSQMLGMYKRFRFKRFCNKNPKTFAKLLIIELLMLGRRHRSYKGFTQFMKQYFRFSAARKVTDAYDVYVIGSDQVWNDDITKHDPTWYADFPFAKGNRRYITYAASTGGYVEPDKEKLRTELARFDAISVREYDSVAELQPYTNKQISVVLDPTLLADTSIWQTIKLPASSADDKFVFAYYAGADDPFARRIARQLGCRVKDSQLYHHKSYEFCASPEEFLTGFRDAQCVVTRSFHAVVFSIIFEKPFYYLLKHTAGDQRISSLLTKLGLQDRMVDGADEVEFSAVDFSAAKATLSQLRTNSMNYLLKALEA